MARAKRENATIAGPSSPPVFRQLAPHEAEALLERNHVGRMAFTFHDSVDIEPISYVYTHGWLYGRTSHGTKLAILTHHHWVAFEVDEVAGQFDWRSVVIKGEFEIVPADLSGPDALAYIKALELLRQLAPDTWTEHDRVPFRNVLFRIHIDEIIGREATSTQSRTD